MEERFIKLNRKFFTNDLWNEARTFSSCEAWLDLVWSARFEAAPRKVSIGGRGVVYSRGQYPASIRFLAVRWQWSEKRVRSFLAHLKKLNMIACEATQGINVITLCGYDEYNGPGKKTFTEKTNLTGRTNLDGKAAPAERTILDGKAALTGAVTNELNKGTRCKDSEKAVCKAVSEVGSLATAGPEVGCSETASVEADYSKVTHSEIGCDSSFSVNSSFPLNNLGHERAQPVEAGHTAGTNIKKEREEEYNIIPQPLEKGSLKNKNSVLHSKARLVFEKHFRKTFSEIYCWTAKDAGNMTALLKKLRFLREQKQMPVDDDSLLYALDYLLNTIKEGWVFENFSVAIINSKFNEIISQARRKMLSTDLGVVLHDNSPDKYNDALW